MIVILPVVSRQSWSLVFLAPLPNGWISDVQQANFVLDLRLSAMAGEA